MTTRRTLLLALALVLAGTLALPSAAAPLFDGQTDRIGGDIELTPSSEYADLDDGELVVDLSASNPDIDGEGVNADGRTTIDDVFHMRYNGSRYAHVWLTHGSDAVTFAVDGDPIQSESTNVTLAPNESVGVSLTVDTTGETVDGFVGDITIHSRVAEPEPDGETDPDDEVASQSVRTDEDSRRFTVLNNGGEAVTFDAGGLELDRIGNGTVTLDRLTMTSPNRSFSVTAETGNTAAAESLVAQAGAEPLGATRFTVNSGNVSEATMAFSASTSYMERKNVTSDALVVYRYSEGDLSRIDPEMTGERNGRLTFEVETSGFSTFVVAADRARIEVDGASVSPSTVPPGEAVSVTATVSNDGTSAGERTVSVRVDDSLEAERTVTVPANESEAVDVPVVRNETGSYDVTVNGTDAGTFRVVEPTDDGTESRSQGEPTTEEASTTAPAEQTEPPVEEASGFGLPSLLGLLGLLLIVAVTLVLARRTPWP